MSRLIEAPKRRIVVYDTTNRDGNQAVDSRLTVDGKLRLAQELDAWGVDYIEGGWPESNPIDEEFFREAKGLTLKHATLVSFGRTRKPHIQAESDEVLNHLLKTETKTVTLFGKSSVFQVREGLRTTLQENLNMIYDSVSLLQREGRYVIYDAEHFFDGYKLNPRYAMRTLEAAVEAGAQQIVPCDTNGGNEPDFIFRVMRRARKRFPDIILGIHTHNDYDLATANAMAAVKAGATHVQGVVNGNGERAGNADLVIVMKNLDDHYNLRGEVDLTKSSKLSQIVAEETGIPVPPNHPFTGENVVTHGAGTHTAFHLRNQGLQLAFEPGSVGREASIGFTDQGGGATVLAWAEKLGFPLSRNDPEFGLILRKMKEKRVFGTAQIYLLFYETLTRGRLPFEVTEGSCVVDIRGKIPIANVKVRINEEIYQAKARGEGLIDAFDNAIRSILSLIYPEVSYVKLVPGSYKDNVSPKERGTSAPVEVSLKLADESDVLSSRVRSSNQQRAGEDAFVEGYQCYILQKRGQHL